MTPPTRGLVAMPADQYHADPCKEPSLSASIAHLLVSKSPAHAWLVHPRLGGKRRKATREMSHGTLVHALLLDTVEDSIAIIDADSYRSKAAQEERAAAEIDGKTPVLAKDFAAAKTTCVAVMEQLLDLGIRLTGVSEIAAFWQERADDGRMIQCRGMLDHLIMQDGIIYDLKTCRSAHPEAIRKHIEAYGYDIQATAYTRAIEQIHPELAGRVEYKWLFLESDEPHCITPAEPAGTMQQLGALRWARAVNTWAQCTASNEWPPYVRDTARIEASKWALEGVFADIEAEAEAQE